MGYSIYQVSRLQTVVVFSQNQKAPNKVGQELMDKMEELAKDGQTVTSIYKVIHKTYTAHQEAKTRGIDSVQLSLRVYDEEAIQDHKIIDLSYKLNGVFCQVTEYSTINKKGANNV